MLFHNAGAVADKNVQSAKRSPRGQQVSTSNTGSQVLEPNQGKPGNPVYLLQKARNYSDQGKENPYRLR